MLKSDTNRHAFHRSAQYQLALRSKAGEERDGALIQLSVEPCSVTVRLAHVIHTHVGPRTNLFCFLCLRTVSGLTREHFKESFDAIFEHLANGGEGGKVSKYTIICLFVVKVSKYTIICLFVVKISKYTMICLFVVKISKYTLSGVKVSKYTFGCLDRRSANTRLGVCLDRRSADTLLFVYSVGQQIHQCLYVCLE